MNTSITKEIIEKAYSYPEYKRILEQMVAEGKTSGHEQSEEKIAFTKLNLQRINRNEKTFEVSPEVKEVITSINTKQYWILIAEAWCGDVAQNLYPIAALAMLNPMIKFGIIFRDENEEVILNYQTNGTKSIPKLIMLDADLREIGVWGPRPKGALEIYKEYKANPAVSKEEFHHNLHLWYARNRGEDLQHEIASIVKLTSGVSA